MDPSFEAASSPFAHLVSPVTIGRRDLRNRIVLLPQGTGLNRDGVPSDADVAYYEARARGGVGLVVCGGTAAHPSSQLRARTLVEAWSPAAVPALARRVAAVHRHGAAIVGQLLCLGREMAAEAMDTAPVAPSAIRSPRFTHPPRALDLGEIAELVESHATSAANLIEAGHDGVEIHAAHGYLVAQFLSPLTNQRADAYGAGVDGRRRFLMEICAAVRERIGPRPMLGVRLSVDEEVPGGITVADTIPVARALEAAGSVDYLSLTVGVRGAYVKDHSAPRGVALERIAEVRAACGLPVIAAGRIVDPWMAEEALRDGVADLIGLSRALIADPDWAAKAAGGRPGRIRPCVGVNQECRTHTAGGLACMVNPAAGREHVVDLGTRADPLDHRAWPGAAGPGLPRRPGPVAVVGGGPAGLEVAHLLAGAGRQVVLWERADALGGQLRAAAAVAPRRELLELVAFQEREARRVGVEICLGEEAGVDVLGAGGWAAVVLAAGAVPAEPDLPAGPGSVPVSAALAVLAAAPPPEIRGRRMVVVDDGSGFWWAPTVAELLAVAGAHVTLATPAPQIGHAIGAESLRPLLARLFAAGATLRTHAVPVAATPEGLEIDHPFGGRAETLPADEVFLHAGLRPAGAELAAALRATGCPVEVIGDAVAPRRVTHAIAEATALAAALGPAGAAGSDHSGNRA